MNIKIKNHILIAFGLLFINLRSYALEKSIVVYLQYPLTTLLPYQYDDWGSTFVGNSIYRPLLNRKGLFQVAENLSYQCTNPRFNFLDPRCKRVRFTFNYTPFFDCNKKKISQYAFVQQLKTLLKMKTWILKHPSFCTSHDGNICLEVDSGTDLERRLQNLYFRFGFSEKKLQTNQIHGSGPYCLLISDFDHKKKTIMNAKMFPHFSLKSKTDLPTYTLTSKEEDSTNFDLSLYYQGSNPDNQLYEEQTIKTPLFYYIISNPNVPSQNSLWDDLHLKKIISNFFHNSPLNIQMASYFAPIGSNHFNESTFLKKPLVTNFILPNFLNNCKELEKQINTYFLKSSSKERKDLPYRAKAICDNSTLFLDQYIRLNKHSKVPIGVLTPLSPGFYGKNSLARQYFSSDSSDSFVTKENNKNYSLVAFSPSQILVRKNFFCQIGGGPLGLGELSVEQIHLCPQLKSKVGD